MIKSQMVSLGARIPASLKRKLASYCEQRGIKLQFFVTESLIRSLEEEEQDQYDVKLAEERMKNPQFINKVELDRDIQKRKKSL